MAPELCYQYCLQPSSVTSCNHPQCCRQEAQSKQIPRLHNSRIRTCNLLLNSFFLVTLPPLAFSDSVFDCHFLDVSFFGNNSKFDLQRRLALCIKRIQNLHYPDLIKVTSCLQHGSSQKCGGKFYIHLTKSGRVSSLS